MKNIPLTDVLNAIATSPNVVSRLPIFEKYDKNVQGNTYVERGQAAVSVILPFKDFPELPEDKKSIGVAVGTGGNPNAANIDAGLTAEMAICAGALKTACVGGEWLGATDCLNFGNPEKEDSMGEFVAGVEGIKTACTKLSIPIVSGNVSLYNECDGKSVPPSALVSVFARVNEMAPIKPAHWQSTEAYIYQVGAQSTALGGSVFNTLFEAGSTTLPALNYDAVLADAHKLRELTKTNGVEAIIPLQAGGVWGTLVGASFASNQGFELNLSSETAVSDLLAETLGALVVSTKELPGLTLLGSTKEGLKATFNIGDEAHTVDLALLKDEWDNQLRSVF